MMMLAIVTGKSFNFHVIETLQNATEGEQLCREMSYDGLAILSSPEMYNYALTITHTLRASTTRGMYIGLKASTTRGMYIGLKYSPETAVTHWEDGTLPAADTPWKDATVAQEEFGLLFSAGLLRMTKGRYHRYALCGYQVQGSTAVGQQPTGVSSSLSVATAPSYMACVLLCGRDNQCRAAEFNSDLLTCILLGPGSYSGLTTFPSGTTFLRGGFQDVS
ncbi:hypothetical protein RRG08_048861 [Elysia crispata]|uniref:Apple domain-containing protein n=1 Tax=Elysia crispata TaxID=231223 RepID=A0AAE1AHA5_9GAST|nr:hypothetical protein RRG08_048861 [Elysia crispata]